MTFVLVSVVYAVAIGEPSFGVVGPFAVGLSLFAMVFAGKPGLQSDLGNVVCILYSQPLMSAGGAACLAACRLQHSSQHNYKLVLQGSHAHSPVCSAQTWACGIEIA